MVCWKIGKSLVMNQPVQLESWKNRWLGVFRPRIRQDMKNSGKFASKTNYQEKISKNPFFGTFQPNFFIFCDICIVEELPNAPGLKKVELFWKCSFSGGRGPFLDRKMLFSMESLRKNLKIFYIQSCSQHISPHFLI